MNISFDKALLWALPYLYLVAIFYYWGYWGTFEIDAINYYPISDLVKGVTARLPNTLAITAFVFALYSAYWFFLTSDWSEKKRKSLIFSLKVLLSLTLLSLIVALIIELRRNGTIISSLASSANQLPFLTLVPLFVSMLISFGVELYCILKLGLRKDSFRMLTIVFLVSLPLNAYSSGKKAAWAVIENEEFDYIVMRKGLMNTGIYKYLGKAGSALFFTTMNNAKHIIITEASVNPLVIEHYLNDRATQNQFRVNLRSLGYTKSQVKTKPPTPGASR